MKIYVATSSAIFFAAKAIASRYGWLKGPKAFQRNEPWLVLDTYYQKAYFTVTPPGSGAVIATAMSDVVSNMPSFEAGNTIPVVVDEYDRQLVLIY